MVVWGGLTNKHEKKRLERIQPVHPKGDQSWVFIGRTALKLKLQYFGHLMRRAESFEKILMLGKIEGRRRRGHRGWDGWMASLTQWTWVWVDSRSWWWTGRPGVLLFMGLQRVGHDWATELNWNREYLTFSETTFNKKTRMTWKQDMSYFYTVPVFL